jgi:hypothetical protein
MWTDDSGTLAIRRWVFATGGGAELVQTLLSQGIDGAPDANEIFAVTLQREAALGILMELYERIIKENQGTVKPEKLLSAIAEAARNDESRAPVADNKFLVLTPSLSLDAGYAEGMLTKPTLASLRIFDTSENVKQLKVVADDCLDGYNPRPPSLKTCYAAGLALAAKDNSLAPATKARVAADIERRRQDVLKAIRTERSPTEIAEQRMFCFKGGESESVRRDRSEGLDFVPDASDACLTVLRRDIEFGSPLELYEQLVKAGKGTATPEELLAAIARAALNDEPRTSIGGQVIEVVPSLSLDAGYTKAYLDKLTLASLGVVGTPDTTRKLKDLAEDCLDSDNPRPASSKACYVAGLTLAARDNSSKRPN